MIEYDFANKKKERILISGMSGCTGISIDSTGTMIALIQDRNLHLIYLQKTEHEVQR